MPAKFELGKDRKGEFTFNLRATNGEIILRSESYKNKRGAVNGIESVKKNSKEDARYRKLVAKNGQHYFNLCAANHQIIGTSETYTTEKARDVGIKSVKTNAASATVVEPAG